MNSIDDLMTAIKAGDEAKVEKLLADDPQLASEYDARGRTPLHIAAYLGHRAIADLLLVSGADLHARSRNELNNQPLHMAAAGEQGEMLAHLISKGADVNSREIDGYTCIHEAALLGQLDMVETLLANGAEINSRKDDGKTPLTLAIEKGQEQAAAWLRQHGGIE